jgi:radical SAM protein with 4Fe4S-binding SPASM domain
VKGPRKIKVGKVEKGEKMMRTFTFQYQITEKCNLRCTHCYEDGTLMYEASTEELIKMLNKFLYTAEKWKVLPLVPLSGGEPLLSPSFWPLLNHLEEYSKKTPVIASVLSNGTLIDAAWAETLAHYSVVDFVQISLDGVTCETHERIRGKGTFQKSIDAVAHLLDAGIYVHIHFVVHRQNYEEAFKLPDFAEELGVENLLVTRLVPFGRGKEMEDLLLEPHEVKTLYTEYGNITDRAIKALSTDDLFVFVNRLRCDWPVICTGDQLSSMEALINKNGSFCKVGRSYIAVMPDGTCYACRRMPIKVGNLLEESFEEVWNHPFLWKMRRKHRYMQGKCVKCPFNSDSRLNFTCMGGASCIAYGKYGDPFMPDPQCSFDPDSSGRDVISRVDRIYEAYMKKGGSQSGNT